MCEYQWEFFEKIDRN